MLCTMAASFLLGVSAAPLPPAASPGSPSQILVLGMHHSGTSLVSNLTMMMGAFGGKTEDMLLHPENPLKFWERRDVVALDERRVAAGVQKAAERYEIPAWVAYGFDESASAERVHESGEARAIVSQLNEQRPWVTKDPRMSLVANEWIELLDAPACVIVHRQPLHVANSMMIYSHNVSFAEWGSVYEAYYSRAMKACANLPTVVVQHEEITANPYAAVKKLHEGLVAAGVQGLTLPAEERIAKLLRPAAPKEVKFLASERKMIGANAVAISEALTAGTAATAEASKAIASKAGLASQWLIAPRKSQEAYATILTTKNADYFRGALVLGSSIRSFDSSRELICLVTAAVPREWRSALSVAGWTVVSVEEVVEFWWGKSKACSTFASDQGERWGHMATKLRLWQMTQYERILYLDADTVLTGDAAHIFSVSTFAAEKGKYHAHFNAGVMLLTPSTHVFDELMALGKNSEAKHLFGNVVDCTEQALLNTYFDGSEGHEVTKLDVGRADALADWESDKAPFAVHWITHVCPKPWLVADGAEARPSHCDPVVYAFWQRIWNRLSASATDESSFSSFGSRESARRKLRRLAGVSAGPSMVGRQRADSITEMVVDVHASIGRQLREVVGNRRALRRRREYDGGAWSEGTWAWIAIIATLGLGLGAGALLHKLFIKAPVKVSKGMTVVQAKRMGFQALGEGKGPIGVVSAVDDDDDEEDEEEYEEEAPRSRRK